MNAITIKNQNVIYGLITQTFNKVHYAIISKHLKVTNASGNYNELRGLFRTKTIYMLCTSIR